jgi:cysteine-rich repeat protein
VEQCDDANASNTDGCLNTCRLATCGDGYVRAGVEQCDDGNVSGGDGCSGTCQLEVATCGNGTVEPGEQCDDGNTSNADACLSTCVVATCGDGFLRIGVEVCDDGNTTSGDGCSGTCQSNERCGNGVVDMAAGEVCDDGNTASGDGCAADCRSNETCGNGVVDGPAGEECDDGNLAAGDGCDPTCHREGCLADVQLGMLPVNVEVSRQLTIAGSGDDAVGCGAGPEMIVEFRTGIAATLQLRILQTGDHAFGLYRDPGPGQCTDDRVSCYDPGGFPTGTTTFPDLPAGRYYLIAEGFTASSAQSAWIYLKVLGTVVTCGNGTREGVEVCDDGNTTGGDGCSADCLSTETCGNGYLDGVKGEVCDDGNTTGGDGCSADCRSNETCGNGTVDPEEVCDDGNVRSGDGCSADCRSDETCPNGYVDTAVGETCDDGNTVGGDGCDAFCHREQGVCYVDETLGLLTPGVPVSRNLNVAAAGDEWTTGCSSLGPEVAMTFEMDRPGNINLQFSQVGDHAYGLYRSTQITTTCTATGGVCIDKDPNQSGWVIFMGRPAGLYYLIIEGNGAGMAGTASIQLYVTGCSPAEDLGPLTLLAPEVTSVNTAAGTNVFRAGCSGASGREQVLAFQLTGSADLELGWSQAGDHVFSLLRESGGDCDDSPIACFDPTGASTGTTTFPRLSAGSYLMMVDAFAPGDEGLVNLILTALPVTP